MDMVVMGSVIKISDRTTEALTAITRRMPLNFFSPTINIGPVETVILSFSRVTSISMISMHFDFSCVTTGEIEAHSKKIDGLARSMH